MRQAPYWSPLRAGAPLLLILFSGFGLDRVLLSQTAPLPIAGGTYVGDGLTATKALIGQAEGLALSPAGQLYIADALDNRIRRVNADGTIETIAGGGLSGFAGDNGPAARALVSQPYGLVLAPDGSLYFCDLGNARVRRILPDGTILTIAGGGSSAPDSSGTQLATAVRLNAPRNLTLDTTGNLYVSDFLAHAIYRITPSGAIARFVGTGTLGFAGDGARALDALLSYPAGVAIGTDGALYVADSGNRRIRRIGEGAITSLPLSGLSTPTGLAADVVGNLYIADPSGRGWRWPIAANSANAAQALGTTGRDVTTGIDGSVYFSLYRNVRRISAQGQTTVFAGSDQYEFYGDNIDATVARLNQPTSLARDSAGYLYIADLANHRVRRVSPQGIISTYAGSGVAGFQGDGQLATQARLREPAGVAVDAQNNVYIADRGNHVVRVVSPNGMILTYAGQGTQAGYQGDGGAANLATLNSPSGLALDSNGDLLIADTGNHVVRRVSKQQARISTAVGNSFAGLSGDGGPPTGATLRGPTALLVTPRGLYISDTGNNRIRLVAGNTIASVLLPTDLKLAQPAGLALTSTNDLLIADSTNARIIRVTERGTASVLINFRDLYPVAVPTALLLQQDQLYYSDILRMTVERVSLGDSAITDGGNTAGPAISIVNAASFASSPVTAGQIVSLFGTNIGPAAPYSGSLTALGRLSTNANGLQVTFAGRFAPIFYAGPNQINVQVPYEIGPVNAAEVRILKDGKIVANTITQVANAAPGLLADSAGNVIASDNAGQLITPFLPARREQIIVLYATGEGLNDPAAQTGLPAAPPYPKPILPVTVTIGDYPAEIVWAGSAPGLVGVLQINVRVPGGFLPSGPQPVRLTIGTTAAQSNAVLAIQ